MTTQTNRSRPSVIVVGGGYAGTAVAKGLDDIADVVLIDPKEAFVHNVASWRALVEPEWLERIFLPYDRLLAQGRVIRDRAVAVEGTRVTLASGDVLDGDYVVLATGSSYAFPAKSDEAETEAAHAKYRAAHAALRQAGSVLIVGAGPSGLELAGEIRGAFPGKRVTVCDAADEILDGPYDPRLRDELRAQLGELGVELVLGSSLVSLPDVPPATLAPVSVKTRAGRELDADIWFRCFGVVLSNDYLRGELAQAQAEDGSLRVDRTLRVVGQERVFALGDIADADRKMAGMAAMQAEVVVANLRAAIAGDTEPRLHEPFPPAIAIPLGPRHGTGQLPGTDGPAARDVIIELKGRTMMLENFSRHFDVPVGATD